MAPRGRSHVPRRDLQCHGRTSRASLSPESGPCGSERLAARDRHRHQGADEILRQELLEASGYGNRPRDFDDLIHILDSELRLITPTDPEGKDDGEPRSPERQANPAVATIPHSGESGYTRYYQLTHDYLVHSLRDWLTRKQKETRRGRAELKLAERSGLWNAKPENRHLPTLWEWLGIRTLTDRRRWTDPQRAMMQRASRFHRSRLTIAAVLVGLITAAGFYTWNRVERYQRNCWRRKPGSRKRPASKGWSDAW